MGGHDVPSSGNNFGYNPADNTERNRMIQAAVHDPDVRTGQVPPPTRYDPGSPPINIDYSGPTGRPTPSANSDAYKQLGGTMESIYPRIMGINVGQLQLVADQWASIQKLLQDVKTDIGTHSDDLSQHGWQSKAASAFLARGPGATMKSTEDWRAAADRNATGMKQVVGAIQDAQRTIQQQYDTYQQQMATVMAALKTPDGIMKLANLGQGGFSEYHHGFLWLDEGFRVNGQDLDLNNDGRGYGNSSTGGPQSRYPLFDDNGNLNTELKANNPTAFSQALANYKHDLMEIAYALSAPARRTESSLAGKVSTATSNNLASGYADSYEGPRNAVLDNPLAPPSVTPPGSPSAPSAPAAPHAPRAPNTPNAPKAPDAPSAMFTKAPPTVPTNTATPNAAPPPPPAAPGAPNAAPPGVPPVAPGMPVAATPTYLSTAGPAGTAAGTPGPPAAPGRGAPGSSPFARPSGATRPTLGGASEEGAGRLPASPNLGKSRVLGQRNAKTPGTPAEAESSRAGMRTPANPGASRGRALRRRPGGKQDGMPAPVETDDLSSTDQPTTAPVLDGRHAQFSPPRPTNTELGSRPGTSRPGSTPGVLNNRPKAEAKKDDRAVRSAPPGTWDEHLAPPRPNTTSVVKAPAAARSSGPANLNEIPEQLRGAHGLGQQAAVNRLAGQPAVEPGTRRTGTKTRPEERRTVAQELAEIRQALGEDAWMVDTPGGAVIENQTDQRRPAQAGPAIGATG